MSRGIIAIGIDEEDELIGVRITDGQQIVFLATHDGMAIRFGEEDVRSMGRPAYGVRGIDLGKSDYVVGLAVTPKKNGEIHRILSVTENGFGKRTDVEEYRLQTRGGKGVINVKTTARNGKVVGIQLVDETSEIIVISQYGKIIRIDTNDRPRGRPLHAGREAAEPRGRRQGGGGGGHSAGRSQDRAGNRDAAAVGSGHHNQGHPAWMPRCFMREPGQFLSNSGQPSRPRQKPAKKQSGRVAQRVIVYVV